MQGRGREKSPGGDCVTLGRVAPVTSGARVTQPLTNIYPDTDHGPLVMRISEPAIIQAGPSITHWADPVGAPRDKPGPVDTEPGARPWSDSADMGPRSDRDMPKERIFA